MHSITNKKASFFQKLMIKKDQKDGSTIASLSDQSLNQKISTACCDKIKCVTNFDLSKDKKMGKKKFNGTDMKVTDLDPDILAQELIKPGPVLPLVLIDYNLF
jgi:hypothetical protein